MDKVLVHLRAPVLSLSGYGFHAREVADYVLSDSRMLLFLENVNWGHCETAHGLENFEKYMEAIARFEETRENGQEFNISCYVTIPNEFERRGQVCIGVTAGIEVDRASPEWLQKCNVMDHVVVPSEFSKKILESTFAEWRNNKTGETGVLKVEKPIYVIPEFFDRPKEGSGRKFEFSTSRNFLSVAQWGKGGINEDRKNIAQLVSTFYQLFKDEPNAGLVLKVNNVSNSQEDLATVVKRLSEIKDAHPNTSCKVHLVHGTLSAEDMWNLYTHPSIKGYVSLTHGEGFGRPLLEASAAGLPVLATDWSGHTDFLRQKHGYIPLAFELKDVPESQIWPGVIEKGSRWAHVDDEDVKVQWKKFYSNPSTIKKQAAENVEWVDSNFSRKSVMEKWRDFFDVNVFELKRSPSEPTSTTSKKPKSAREVMIAKLSEAVENNDRPKVLFIMPRSAGDVLISTAIVNSLLAHRHKDHDFYYAVLPEYADILGGLSDKVKIIDFKDEMMHEELTRDIWTECVYNPGVNIQYLWSNWRLGSGKYALRLLEEMAKQCNINPQLLEDYVVSVKECKVPTGQYITFFPGGAKTAKEYMYWDDVISNIKSMMPDVSIVQLGAKDERLYDGCLDYRGVSYSESSWVVKNGLFGIGIDTFAAHLHGALAKPHLVLYGSTNPENVCPLLFDPSPFQVLIDTIDRNGCVGPCYKDDCANRVDGKNCISNIPPRDVCSILFDFVKRFNHREYLTGLKELTKETEELGGYDKEVAQ